VARARTLQKIVRIDRRMLLLQHRPTRTLGMVPFGALSDQPVYHNVSTSVNGNGLY
jgi:hypothetical protein